MTDSNTKTEVKKISETECAKLASLLDLFGEHQVIEGNPTLAGALAVIKGLHIEIWNKLEAACE